MQDPLSAIIVSFSKALMTVWIASRSTRKRHLGRIERPPAYTECDRGDRFPIDLVTPQHFVTHLHQIASIDEVALPERFVMHEVGIRMQ